MWMRLSPRRPLLAIAGIALVLGLVAYVSSSLVRGDPVSVQNARFVEEDGSRFLTGSIVNGSLFDTENIALETHFFDAEGTMLGSARLTMTLLEGSEEWEFDIPVRYADAVRFETSLKSGARR